MPTTFIGLSSAERAYKTHPYKVTTTGLKQYAAVIFDSAADGQSVKAPTAAGNTGFAGIIMNAQAAAGTTTGDLVDVAYEGEVPMLLDAGQAVTVGALLQISDTDGSVKASGTTDSIMIIGQALATRTAGAANEPVLCRIAISYQGDYAP